MDLVWKSPFLSLVSLIRTELTLSKGLERGHCKNKALGQCPRMQSCSVNIESLEAQGQSRVYQSHLESSQQALQENGRREASDSGSEVLRAREELATYRTHGCVSGLRDYFL